MKYLLKPTNWIIKVYLDQISSQITVEGHYHEHCYYGPRYQEQLPSIHCSKNCKMIILTFLPLKMI